jgi:hypothetical protein
VNLSVSDVNAIARNTAFDSAAVEKVLRLKELLTEFWKHPFLKGKQRQFFRRTAVYSAVTGVALYRVEEEIEAQEPEIICSLGLSSF